jgi:cell division protein FtsI (penicillin-binding protein 3)
MNIRANILLRVYLAFGLIVLFAFAVLVRLGDVQFRQGEKWRAKADSLSTKEFEIEAARGNIYSNDGSLLATSVPEYELRMDMIAGGIAKDEVFNSKVDSLAMKLSAFFGNKDAKEYARDLKRARQEKSRSLLIKKNVTYQDLKIIKTFPLFNLGKHGGLIATQKNKRILPFKDLARRTIGYANENVKNVVGLEGAYGKYINGESGKQLMQRVGGGFWVPVNSDAEIAPKDGADIISTIDINMQDLAQNALRKGLERSKAHHGAVIVMEVATGEIRAIANYTRESEGVYKEAFNYAIAGNQDPGSTFKLASYMALLEDKLVDTNTMVNTENYPIGGGHIIKDSHGSKGWLTVKQAFEQSSNAAIASLVNTKYQADQSKFTDHLYAWKLNEKMGLQIYGEAQPVVKNPKTSKSWNKGMTLPQMAYGYEMMLTPLKLLSFYNAVANDGKYITPLFVKEIRRLGNPIEQFHAKVITEKICSDVTLSKLKAMLEGVVANGSGKQVVYNPLYKIAGKTGTAQVADQNLGYKAKKQYQASFVGYFPAEKPKYSMIVVINDPIGEYYGALVSGPVFREIADKIYASDVQMYSKVKQNAVGNTVAPEAKAGQSKATKQVYNAFGIKALYAAKSPYFNSIDTVNGIAYQESSPVKGTMPNVNGMGLKDAMYLIGNAGLKARVRGSGKVTSQSIQPGSKIGKGLMVEIELQ